MTARTILCFGDSNTHGTLAMRNIADRRRFPPDQRWPKVMAAALGPDFEVVGEGHPGRTSVFDDPVEGAHKSGLRSLPVLLESHRPVNLVILMLGTNDLKARFGVPASDIALGIDRLIVEVLGSEKPRAAGASCRARADHRDRLSGRGVRRRDRQEPRSRPPPAGSR